MWGLENKIHLIKGIRPQNKALGSRIWCDPAPQLRGEILKPCILTSPRLPRPSKLRLAMRTGQSLIIIRGIYFITQTQVRVKYTSSNQARVSSAGRSDSMSLGYARDALSSLVKIKIIINK
jgi:hypothetical protein